MTTKYDMEHTKLEKPKLPDMIMCGDHPSFTKAEMMLKEEKELKARELEKDKQKLPMSYARLTPTSSRTDRPPSDKSRATSEHALRLIEARRHARSLEVVPRTDDARLPANQALMQAAMGSFRWPPYLLAVWVFVLVAAHALHCVASMLERALPSLKKMCKYFRTWTEESWRLDTEINHRVYPLALACLTGLVYTLYAGLYVLYSITVWSMEPLCSELEEKRSSMELDVKEAVVVNEVTSKTETCK